MRLKIPALSIAFFALVIFGYYQLNRSNDSQEESVSLPTEPASVPIASISRSNSISDKSSQTQFAPDSSASKESVALDTLLADKMSLLAERRPRQKFNPEDVAKALTQTAAWTHVDTVPQGLPLKPEELTDGREFIKFSPLKLEIIEVGETLEIQIKEISRTFSVTIDNVNAANYDSITWDGHFVGADGQTYRATFSRGEKLLVGGIDTPDGHYVVQAHGEDGWVASSELLFKVDPGHATDAVLPPKLE